MEINWNFRFLCLQYHHSSYHLVKVVEFYTYSNLLYKVGQDFLDIKYYMILLEQI